MFSSSNPLSNADRIINASRSHVSETTGVVTVRSAATKAVVLTAVCLVGAILAYSHAGINNPAFLLGSIVISLIAYFVGMFVPSIAFVCAPVYALSEGVYLGIISAYVDSRYGAGISSHALNGTICVAGVIFAGYASGVFKPGKKLYAFAAAAGMALFLCYLINFALSFFGHNFTSIGDTSLLGFGINIVAIVVAAVYLLLDFDQLYRLEGNADKRYEWVWSMGILATIVWLYVELLKLFAKLNSRD